MNLAELIADPDTSLLDIAAHLDSLDHARRWAEVGRLDRGQQRTLYRKAEGSAVDLTHFVPVSAPLTEITHDGRNTLPVPPALRRFQKKFCRPAVTEPGTPVELFGYN